MKQPPAASATATRLEALAWPLIVASVVALPLSLHLYSEVRRADDLFTSSTAYVPDLAILALLVLGIPLLELRRRAGIPVPRSTLALGALALGLVPSLLVHPSPRGLMLVGHWAGAAVFAGLLAGTEWRHRRTLLEILAAVVSFEAVLALAQQHRGVGKGRVLPWFLGEVRIPVVSIGSSWAPAGTTVHPYMLAALMVAVLGIFMAAALRVWAPTATLAWGAAACGAGLVLTASRAGVVGAVLVVVVGAAGAWRFRPGRTAVQAIVAGAALGAAVFLVGAPSPWTARYDQLNTPGADQLSGRGELVHEAIGLTREHPVFGVGPGRYVEVLRADPKWSVYGTRDPAPVHVMPLLFVAEGGLPALAGLAVAAAIGFGLVRRGGLAGLAALSGLAPFVFLDHLTYTHAQGVLLTGMCVGFLELAAVTGVSPGRHRRDVRNVGVKAI